MRRYALPALQASLVIALVLWAAYHRVPLLHRLKPVFPLGMLLAGGLLAACLWRREGRGRWLLAGLCAAALGMGAAVEVRFQAARQAVLEADPQVLQRLGRHLVVGFEDWDAVAPLVERGAIAGVFLAPRNVRGASVEQVREQVGRLRGVQADAGRSELLVMADQEGGRVSRMSPPLPYLGGLGEMVAAGTTPAEDQRLATAFGTVQGEGLAALGVNVNLGPVVDVPDAGAGPVLDAYSRLSTRAISGDAAEVARVAAWYAQGLEAQGVRATFKHFPGLGLARADTHLFETALPSSVAQLAARDWLPYRAALAGTASLVMVGHVLVPEVDPAAVASLSRAVVQGVLRDRLGHQGLVITDDLCMRPVTGSPGGLREAGTRALNAGVDLLLVSYDSDQYFEVMAGLLEAAREGRLDLDQLARSDARLAAPVRLARAP